MLPSVPRRALPFYGYVVTGGRLGVDMLFAPAVAAVYNTSLWPEFSPTGSRVGSNSF